MISKLAPIALIALIPLLVCLVAAQDKIVSKVTNYARIQRAWNSIVDTTNIYNVELSQAEISLKEMFNPKVLVANPDEKRRVRVGHYKAAKEAMLKELDHLNELIEEEDY